MSHYAVAVFSNDPDGFDDLLAPYDENSHFTRHIKDKEKLRDEFDKFLLQNPSWEELGFDHWLEDMGYNREGDEIVSYHNDNAKWDWYTLDGKDYMFPLKRGVVLGDGEWYHRKNDYIYDQPDEDFDTDWCERFWDVFVMGKPAKDGEKFDSLFNKNYYIDRYGTKERYLKCCSIVHPYAFITPDGAWHAPGNMGWFAIDDATDESYERYMDEWMAYVMSDENPYVSFVDCHI